MNGDKINFPGGGTHFHYGADKYIASIAKVVEFFLVSLLAASLVDHVPPIGGNVGGPALL